MALCKLETKAPPLGTLPLSDKEKVAALVTSAYPVFDVVGKLFYYALTPTSLPTPRPQPFMHR